MKRARVHWQARILSGGQVWTACGHVVAQELATLDCAEVTCIAEGCLQEAEKRRALRAEIRKRTWEELIELRDTPGCGDE